MDLISTYLVDGKLRFSYPYKMRELKSILQKFVMIDYMDVVESNDLRIVCVDREYKSEQEYYITLLFFDSMNGRHIIFVLIKEINDDLDIQVQSKHFDIGDLSEKQIFEIEGSKLYKYYSDLENLLIMLSKF